MQCRMPAPHAGALQAPCSQRWLLGRRPHAVVFPSATARRHARPLPTVAATPNPASAAAAAADGAGAAGAAATSQKYMEWAATAGKDVSSFWPAGPVPRAPLSRLQQQPARPALPPPGPPAPGCKHNPCRSCRLLAAVHQYTRACISVNHTKITLCQKQKSTPAVQASSPQRWPRRSLESFGEPRP